MTINTSFSVGATLTAAQCNNFPRGLTATPADSIVTETFTSTEEVMLTYTFSQVSGRNYLFTYIEPNLTGTAASTATMRFRQTNLAGSIYNTLRANVATSTNTMLNAQYLHTATSSGSLTIVATIQISSGTATATRSSSQIASLWAVDIGTGY